MKRLLSRLLGKRRYQAGTLYKRYSQWQPVGLRDALSISLIYGYSNVAWGRW